MGSIVSGPSTITPGAWPLGRSNNTNLIIILILIAGGYYLYKNNYFKSMAPMNTQGGIQPPPASYGGAYGHDDYDE